MGTTFVPYRNCNRIDCVLFLVDAYFYYTFTLTKLIAMKILLRRRIAYLSQIRTL
jgi:hypothetical protein